MITVGIIDDEKMALSLLRTHVENYFKKTDKQYNIQLFLSGKEAIQHCDKMDIIFLDIEMPDMDGIESGRQIIMQHKYLVTSTNSKDF